MAKIDNLFHLLHANHGSDLHLSAGNPPLLRIYGDLARVDAPVVTTEELLAVLREMVPMDRVQAFEQTGDLDFAYEIPGLARYRANFFRQNRGISAVFREIPQQISTVEELGLPIMLRELALLPKGLVLVTGPTGAASPPRWPRSWTTPIPSAATISLPLKTPSNSCINPRAAS